MLQKFSKIYSKSHSNLIESEIKINILQSNKDNNSDNIYTVNIVQ